MTRALVVSIDTEVDKGTDWRIADPATFRSVVEGVPEALSPLFDRYGAVPTYLLSAEVIEDDEASRVLARLGTRAELGTHLHAQFVEPQRQLWADTMAGKSADHIQSQYPDEVERAKLQTLTESFTARFGWRPTSFRAGRYGSSSRTLEFLAGLGYVVDSSVTPGLVWRYPEGVVDHRRWPAGPRVVDTAAGPIVELPVSVQAGGRLAPMVAALPPLARRVTTRAIGARSTFAWLRPSWARPGDLAAYAATASEEVLVAMFHSMEVVPGASPYATDRQGVERILHSLEELLRYCAGNGVRMVGMTAAATSVREA